VGLLTLLLTWFLTLPLTFPAAVLLFPIPPQWRTMLRWVPHTSVLRVGLLPWFLALPLTFPAALFCSNSYAFL
jgi:hypothetical protein